MAPNISALPVYFRLVLIRGLDEVSMDVCNRSVVEQYGHCRYSYRLSSMGFVQCILVESSALLQTAMVVIDP